MGGIEPLVVFPVAMFHFPVMSGDIGADHFMSYPMFFQAFLGKRGGLSRCVVKWLVNFAPLSVWIHSIVQGNALIRCSTNCAEE